MSEGCADPTCRGKRCGFPDRVTPAGLHACVGCGIELDGDDPNERCEDCPAPTP